MVATVRGATCLDGWQEAVRHLLDNRREEFSLLVIIDAPTRIEEEWLTKFDPSNIKEGTDRIRSVGNTVFPEKIWRFSRDRAHFYSRYARFKQLARAMRSQFGQRGGQWGTYFDRLINFNSHPKSSGSNPKNQLEEAITKLRSWPHHPKAQLVFHLSSPETDHPRTRGGPCWHYGELCGRPGNICDFTVVYRNHDYFNKALGNFIALGRLLEFICAESGKIPGQLVCHSVHAYFDVSQKVMRKLAGL